MFLSLFPPFFLKLVFNCFADFSVMIIHKKFVAGNPKLRLRMIFLLRNESHSLYSMSF